MRSDVASLLISLAIVPLGCGTTSKTAQCSDSSVEVCMHESGCDARRTCDDGTFGECLCVAGGTGGRGGMSAGGAGGRSGAGGAGAGGVSAGGSAGLAGNGGISGAGGTAGAGGSAGGGGIAVGGSAGVAGMSGAGGAAGAAGSSGAGGSPPICTGGTVLCAMSCVSLDDPLHCGACDHDCLGGTCVARRCAPVQLAIGQSQPTGIAVDDTFVYWANFEATPDGAVLRVAKSGGMPTPLVPTADGPLDVAVAGSTLYYFEKFGTTTVYAVPLAAPTPTPIAAGEASPARIAADATGVFWTTENGGAVRTTTGSAGSDVVTGQNTPASIVIDADQIYWTTFGDDAVRRADRDGNSMMTVASSENNPASIFIAGAGAYWVNRVSTSGAVRTKPKDGSGIATSLATNLDNPGELVVDATHVYFTVQGSGAVQRVPLGGGMPEDVATGQSQPISLAQDGASLYWTNFSDGTVWRITKPLP